MEFVIVMMVLFSFCLADALGEYDAHRDTWWGLVILPSYAMITFGVLWISSANGWLLWK